MSDTDSVLKSSQVYFRENTDAPDGESLSVCGGCRFHASLYFVRDYGLYGRPVLNNFEIAATSLMACICWEFESNCTRMLSESDPLEIVVIKGFGSGTGALLIALAQGGSWPDLIYIPGAYLAAGDGEKEEKALAEDTR